MPRELIATAPGETAIREYKDPPLEHDQIRIKSEFAAPKHGTEAHGYLPESPSIPRVFDPEYRIFLPQERQLSGFPRNLGNMTVGLVIDAGSEVTKFKIGDRVYGHLPIRETHTVGEYGRNKGKHIASGVRENRLHKVPEGMADQQVVCLDPAHFALAGVRDANVRLGERVAVFGLGAIGLMVVQMAKKSGAELVFAVDPLPHRRALAEKFGADQSFDPSRCDVGYEIKRTTNKKGMDVAIEASGAYPALQDAIRCVHYSGLVVTISFYHGPAAPLRLGEEWHLTRVTVLSSMPVWGNPSRDYPMWDDERLEDTVLKLMIEGTISADGIIDPVYPFDKADEGYRLINEHPNQVVKLGISF